MAWVMVHCPRCQSAQVYCHGKTQKDMIGSAAVTVIASFSSLTLMKPANPELKSRSLKWLSAVPGFAIPPEH